ncbi:SubName: Full=Uncharacterized protein {ECO:0000313/EMBL:CCA71105.1} [Serendipita indica DSM 11827]|nr:SubName: Full=Uncharacterized protein {ECO:0000313/EMBL:CCA71105.1} [Serendipita indica DSM 11827]
MASGFYHRQQDYSDSDADASGSDIDVAETLYDGRNGTIMSLKPTFADKVMHAPQSLAAIPALQPSNSISLHPLNLPSILPPDTPTTAATTPSLVSPAALLPTEVREDDDPEAGRQRMKTYIQEILHHAECMPHAQTTLDGIRIPEANNSSLSSVLRNVVEKDGELPSENGLNIALDSTLWRLAASRTFKHPLPPTPPSPAPSDSTDVNSRHQYSQQSPSYSHRLSTAENSRKRKRDALDQPRTAKVGHKHPRTSGPGSSSPLSLVHEGIQRVLQAFQNNVIDKHLIGSVQLQLHHVFLFAVTSESVASSPQKRKTLGDISKLIQLLGVLSGVQISVGDPTTTLNITTLDEGRQSSYNSNGPLIFPCPLAGCIKTFTKLYSLRSHQQTHLSTRPYHCNECPASFSRAHDLTRHMRSHTLQVYRCKTCQKSFSRRDAFRRHCQNTKRSAARSNPNASKSGDANPCKDAGYDIVDAPAGQKKTASFWERSKNGPSRAASSRALGSNDEAGVGTAQNESADDDEMAMRGTELGASNGSASSTSNGGGQGHWGNGSGGEELETDEVPLREFEGTLEEMMGLHELLRSTVENMLATQPVTDGHAQTRPSHVGSSRSLTSYPPSHPTTSPVRDATDTAMYSFLDLFPSLDFNSVGLTVDHLSEVERLVQEAKSTALSEAEREAAQMEVVDNTPT